MTTSVDTAKIRELIATARDLADELEAQLDGAQVSSVIRTDAAITKFDPLNDPLPEKADVRDNATRRQKDMGIFVLFSTLYAVNRRHNRGLAGGELRDLAHVVRYSDLRSLVQWEKYAMVRDKDGFRWVTEGGHKHWVAGLSEELKYELPDDLATWVAPGALTKA
jgi:hypothetical protein